MFPVLLITTLAAPQAVKAASLGLPGSTQIEYIDPPQGTLGITQIRDLINSLHRPLLNPNVKTVVVSKLETATTQAQNALLKTLEEPPPNCILILISSSVQPLLPTLRSRCRVIHLSHNPPPQTLTPEIVEIADQLTQLSAPQRIQAATKFSKNALSVKNTLQQLAIMLHQQLMTKPSNATHQHNSRLILVALKNLVSNAHPALTLEHVFLHWQ